MPKDHSGDKDVLCSFCGKGQDEVKKLIAGPTVYICDECIELCNDIVKEDRQKDAEDKGEAADLKGDGFEVVAAEEEFFEICEVPDAFREDFKLVIMKVEDFEVGELEKTIGQ